VPRIAIIYFSATGTTAALADAVAAGAATAADVHTHRITAADLTDFRFRNDALIDIADAADAIAFGAPTYMGGPAAQFKAFADATSDRWTDQRWRNKLAAGFTSGACPNGDQALTRSEAQRRRKRQRFPLEPR